MTDPTMPPSQPVSERSKCQRCPALPWFSIGQPPDDEPTSCFHATIEMLACKRHLAAVLTEDFPHNWDPREVHVWIWDEWARDDEARSHPPLSAPTAHTDGAS